MLNGPFSQFDDYDDDGFFGSPYRRAPFGGSTMYNSMNSRRALEERRRQAEMKKYNQRKAQQLQREREEEAFRRRQAQDEYFRRMYEAKQEEDLRRQRLAQQQQHYYPPHTIVRDPYGRLHRVPVEHNHDVGDARDMHHPHSETMHPPYTSPPPKLQRKSEQQPRNVRGPDGRSYRGHRYKDEDYPMDLDIRYGNGSYEKDEKTQGSPVPMTSDDLATNVNVSAAGLSSNASAKDCKRGVGKGGKSGKSIAAKENFRRRVTVMVEDVPESEYEDEEIKSMKSAIRNRHPGPGESWMQPIGTF